MPEIKTTLGKLMDAAPALTRVTGLALPPKKSYHLMKLKKLVGTELDLMEEQRQKLLKLHGTERPATAMEMRAGWQQEKMHEIPPDDSKAMLAFVTAFRDLRAADVTLPWGPFNGNDFDGGLVTAADLGPLTDANLVVWDDKKD